MRCVVELLFGRFAFFRFLCRSTPLLPRYSAGDCDVRLFLLWRLLVPSITHGWFQKLQWMVVEVNKCQKTNRYVCLFLRNEKPRRSKIKVLHLNGHVSADALFLLRGVTSARDWSAANPFRFSRQAAGIQAMVLGRRGPHGPHRKAGAPVLLDRLPCSPGQ